MSKKTTEEEISALKEEVAVLKKENEATKEIRSDYEAVKKAYKYTRRALIAIVGILSAIGTMSAVTNGWGDVVKFWHTHWKP